MYDQERSRPKSVAYDEETHKNLLLIALEGFRVHMKLNLDQEVPRVPKSIKEGLKTKPKFGATNLDWKASG